ncbi:MAG: hypothetical protein J5885_01070 [Clostridia bacterium]|nr:hypothetical protein [Clostridia bacterium]
MKSFLKEHSYDAVKMFLNQFATAIFGFVLALAAVKANNPTLRNITSAFAVLFYLFLLYTMTWDLGFRDKISVEKGRKPFRPFTGFFISLIANIPNFILALFIMLASLADVSAFSKIGGVCGMIAVVIEGMYTGLLANRVNDVPLHSLWWMFFLIILPALIVSTVAYILGVKDKKFTGLFKFQYPESDREPKRKKKDDE